VLGVLQREVGEQRVDRREPVVAGLRRVAAIAFEVLQEGSGQRRVERGEVELAGWLSGPFAGEGQ
jgi:hypothetical protein